MRYLATIGFCLVAFISILLADHRDDHLVWAIGLAIQPIFWFRAVGNKDQWRVGETVAFIVFGITGLTCFWLWGRFGDLDYPLGAFGTNLHLALFWASAGIVCLKLGGTILHLTTPGIYNPDYIKEAQRWAFLECMGLNGSFTFDRADLPGYWSLEISPYGDSLF